MKFVYFATIREQLDLDEEELDLPQELLTVEDLLNWQKQRGELYELAFEDPIAVRVALDQMHALPQDALAGATEIAFFPPMTGG